MSACGLIVFYLIFSWFWNVWPFHGEDIGLHMQKPKYEVYFYIVGGNEEYLGSAMDLDSCAGKAYLKAKEKNIVDPNKWKYRCKL